ncbi:unnamed protein product, partial [Phaeothamnion confervicola]
LRRAHRGQEFVDLDPELPAFLRQRLRRGQHLGRGGAGLACTLVNVGDVGGDLRRQPRGLLHVAGDFLGRGTLFLDRGGDGRGDFRDRADGLAD